jgi:hypothetical protein
VTPLRTANVLDKAAKLLAQSNEDLVFILYGLYTASRLGEVFVWVATWCAGKLDRRLTIEEGDELLTSSFSAESKSNGRETVDGVETKQNIIVLKSNRESAMHDHLFLAIR